MAESSSNLTHGAPGAAVLDPRTEERPWLRSVLVVEQFVARADNVLLIGCLLGSVLFAFLSFSLRNLGTQSSPWFDVLPRILTMGVGFIGAAIATREGSHICLDLASRFLPPKIARMTRLGAETIAFMVAVFLTKASLDFIGFEMEGGSKILDAIPSWWPAVILVWGFGFAAIRFLLRAGQIFPPMLAVAPIIAAAVGILASQDHEVARNAAWYLAGLGILLGAALGMPLFAILGGMSLLFFWNDEIELAAVPIEIYRLTEAPVLVTLPLFTLIGGILAEGGAPQRLVRVSRALLGWAPGGLAVAAVVVCAFFTTFTGASGVTILALGMLLFKMLGEEGYSENLSIGLVTASGSIGLLFAPALPLIIYGIVGKVDIDKMFVAGIGPGMLLIAFVAGAAVLMARRAGALKRHPFTIKEAVDAIRGAAWELMLPVIVLGLLITGFATVVEASAVGALYILIVATFIHRDIHWRRELPGVIKGSGVLIGAVLIILGVALAFTGYLVDAEVPQMVVDFAKEHLESKWAFLLAMNLLLLVVGCLLDIFSAIIIFVPLLMPVALAFGVNPIHLGIIFLANLEIGYLTPPVGMNLFLSSFRFQRPLPQIWKTSAPYLLVLLAALMIITYVPELTMMFLPEGAGEAPREIW